MFKIYYKTELCVGKGSMKELNNYKNEHILVVADPFLEKSGQLEHMLSYFVDFL